MHTAPLNAETLFHQTLEIEPPERAAFLSAACGSDTTLRRRVEALLAAHEQASGFLPEQIVGDMPNVSAETSDSESIGTMIGRYKLLEKIGEGGFGVVWAAEQREPIRRRVALKVIKLGMDTKQVIARFEAERQALALMDHPNIAKVLEAGATDSGRPYFVMELVRGIPITQYCDQEALSTRGRLDLFIKVCHAIQHAHQKGIIHRDIKPSNILVTLHDGVPVPKVIDFGIAKATQAELTEKTIYTQFQQFIGTPAYMSPEQAEMSGLDIDTRSDIYSLGVLLYELLTGGTPFDGKALLQAGLDEMRRIIREQEPLRPSTRLSQELVGDDVRSLKSSAERQTDEEIRASSRRLLQLKELIHVVRGDLDWIVMKCLEKDRARRYETANGLAMDLTRHLNDETIVARPPSSAYRMQKAFRRNKLAFAAATVVLAALVVGFGVSAWQATIATRARKTADTARVGETQQRLAAESAQQQAERERSRAEAGEKSGQQLLYAANMNLAQQAWEQNNIGRVRQLLEETAAYPDRGFEWYYWQRQTHLEIRTFRGHTDGIWSVAYSPDGRRIATGSSDHTAKVWDVASGEELHTLKGHSDWVGGIAFSPDGQRIVTGSADQTARMWDAASGKELRVFTGHTHWITSVAFSPDGQRIATGSHDNTAKVWDTASGKNLLTLSGHSIRWGPAVSTVAFSPDGQRIATGSYDMTAKVWDVANGKELFPLIGHTNGIRSVAFSSDGERIVTGSEDQKAKVWDAAHGKELLHLSGHNGRVASVDFSADSQRIATGSADSIAKIWDTQSGKELFAFKGHSDGISSIAFSPDGGQILTGSRGHVAKLWDATGTKEVLTLSAHTNWVTSVAFSPDGKRLVTTSYDNTVKIWDVASGTRLFIHGHSDEIWSAAFSHDGRRIVSGSRDLTAKVWEIERDREPLTLTGHGQTITSVAFSADDRRIVTGSHDHTAKIWDAANGKELLRLEGHTDFVTSVAVSPDDQRVATGSYDGTARIWDAAAGKELFKLPGRIAAITATHPAFGSGANLTLKGRSAAVSSVAFSFDGRRLATGSTDGTASIWDVAKGEELLILKGHNTRITSVAFSPDGQRIVTGSHDRTAKVWEAGSGKELLSLAGQSGLITSVAFSPDGQKIVASSAVGTARIWEAATAKQVAVWQQEEQAAARRLVTVRREEAITEERNRTLRDEDPGMIKQWLLLAPIAFEGVNATAAVDQEQISNERRLRPHAGDKIKVGASDRVWSTVQLEDYLLDFTKLLRSVNEINVAYAVCYIQSAVDHADLVMKVGSDDRAKVYLNGREIHRRLNARTYIADQDAVSGVELKAGINVLVFKLVNGTRAWQGSIRLTDAEDQPLKGIKVTLEPK